MIYLKNILRFFVFLLFVSCATKSKLPAGFPDPAAWTSIDSEIMASDIVKKLIENNKFKELKTKEEPITIYLQAFANNSKFEFDEIRLGEDILAEFEKENINTKLIADVSETSGKGLLLRGSINSNKSSQKDEKSIIYKVQCSMIKQQTGEMINSITVEIKKYLH